MKEELLKNFFEGIISIDDLRADLVGAVQSESQGTILRYPIVDMDEEYTVTCQHLISLCDAVLDNHLSPETLEPLGFCMMASDYFEWDSDTDDGDRVSLMLHYWSSPEINYPLNFENIKMFKEILKSSVDKEL